MNTPAYNRAYYLATRERQLATQQARRDAETPEERSARCKRMHDSNKAKRNAYMRKWRAANPERLAVLTKAWALANREKTIGYHNARRARVRGAGGRYTEDDVWLIWCEQGGKCPGCLDPLGDGFQRDHVVALAAGGSNDAENIQLLCKSCNCAKRDRPLSALLAQRGI